MVKPLSPCQKREGKISYGISSYGYDARIGYKFKVFTPVHCGVVDPKSFDEKSFVEVETDNYILIPPNSFALGETIEEFDIPRDCIAVVLGKSTYARCGIIVNVTPLEPEWRGRVTVEISNTSPLPAKVYAGEGIMQVLFFRADCKDAVVNALERLMWSGYDDARSTMRNSLALCRTSYADKAGKYQNQGGIILPKVD